MGITTNPGTLFGGTWVEQSSSTGLFLVDCTAMEQATKLYSSMENSPYQSKPPGDAPHSKRLPETANAQLAMESATAPLTSRSESPPTLLTCY